MCVIGSANPMLSSQDVLDADKLVTEIMSLSLEGDTSGMYVSTICHFEFMS